MHLDADQLLYDPDYHLTPAATTGRAFPPSP